MVRTSGTLDMLTRAASSVGDTVAVDFVGAVDEDVGGTAVPLSQKLSKFSVKSSSNSSPTIESASCDVNEKSSHSVC